MDRDGDVITKGVVVEQVDAEKEHDIDQPAPNGHLVRSYEEWRPGSIKLRDISRDRDEKKLHKSQERPCKSHAVSVYSNATERQDEDGAMGFVPLAGSTLWNSQET